MDAMNGDDTPTPNAGMKLALEENWLRAVATLPEALDEETVKLMRQVYWFGVSTGVQVFNNAMEGKYGRVQR